tara:strand:- start:615 stop:815 length:201 start_codon:yes stop_codon:yes gene_type:complete
MTIEELLQELNEAVSRGYPLDTVICVDMLDSVSELQDTYWDLEVDSDSLSPPPYVKQSKLAINVGG